MAIKRNQGAGRGVIFIDLKGKPQFFEDKDGNKKHGAMVMAGAEKGAPKEILPSNSSITGYVTDLDVHESQYQGDTITSLRIRIEDDQGQEPPVVMSVTLGSYFGAKVVGLLNAADLTKPLAIIANTVAEGDKMGTGVATKDNVFPTMRQGADDARLVPVYAGGLLELPPATEVKVSGKTLKDMTVVNDLVAATIGELYAKLEAIAESNKTPDHGDSIDPAEAAAAIEAAQHERARG